MALTQALLPVFSLIILGLLIARLGFPGTEFWGAAERLIYYLLLPCLLFTNLAQATLAGLPLDDMGIALALPVLAVSGLTLMLRPLLGIDGRDFGALFQGAIRQNTYVGLAGAAALGGSTGLTLAAVAIAVLIPLLNLLSVGVMTRCSAVNASWGRAAQEVLRNPLILACGAGICVNLTGLGLPSLLAEPLSMLGRASLPLGLLSVGAALRFSVSGRELLSILVSSGAKLLLMPLLVLLLSRQLELGADVELVLVLFAALPTSVSSYILARQLGANEHLMASIITVQTLLAMASMPWVLNWVN
jgi:malonate transporter